jgi:hypothetical protein
LAWVPSTSVPRQKKIKGNGSRRGRTRQRCSRAREDPDGASDRLHWRQAIVGAQRGKRLGVADSRFCARGMVSALGGEEGRSRKEGPGRTDERRCDGVDLDPFRFQGRRERTDGTEYACGDRGKSRLGYDAKKRHQRGRGRTVLRGAVERFLHAGVSSSVSISAVLWLGDRRGKRTFGKGYNEAVLPAATIFPLLPFASRSCSRK